MTLVKLLKNEFIRNIQPKIVELGFVPSTFQKTYFGSDEQGGFQYDFMRIQDDVLEMLYANIVSRSRGIQLRYNQFYLPADLRTTDRLSHMDASIAYNPLAMQQSLSFDPIWSWWRMLVPSPYSISRLSNAGAKRERAISRIGKRLAKDLDYFDLFKTYWEQKKKVRELLIPVGQVGLITVGKDNGKFVRVDEDSVNTGGFLIIVSTSDQLKDGSDDWVKDRDSLEKYFVESNWNVIWRE